MIGDYFPSFFSYSHQTLLSAPDTGPPFYGDRYYDVNTITFQRANLHIIGFCIHHHNHSKIRGLRWVFPEMENLNHLSDDDLSSRNINALSSEEVAGLIAMHTINTGRERLATYEGPLKEEMVANQEVLLPIAPSQTLLFLNHVLKGTRTAC